VDEAAAGEAGKIERDGLDVAVSRGAVHGTQQVAGADLGLARSAAQHHAERVRLHWFFHHGAVEPQQQCAVVRLGRAGAHGERSVEHAEEQQQEQQRQRVLDADQQTPDLACENH